MVAGGGGCAALTRWRRTISEKTTKKWHPFFRVLMMMLAEWKKFYRKGGFFVELSTIGVYTFPARASYANELFCDRPDFI